MAEVTTFDNAYVRAFGSKIDLLQQQMDPRIRGAVREESLKGAEALELDQVVATNLVARTVRNSDTPIINIPHRRRVCQGQAYEAADLIDPIDQARFQLSFEDSFVRTWAAAATRQHDKNVIDAFFATAVTGKAASGTAAFDTAYSIASGSIGMSVAKLRTAARILKAAENMKDNGDYKWYVAYTSAEQEDLLATTEVTSADFNVVRALVNGEVDEFLGFKHIHTEQINVVSAENACAAWCKNSMLLGVAESGMARIEARADKSYAVQVYYRIDSGATRMDEKGVVRIFCA